MRDVATLNLPIEQGGSSRALCPTEFSSSNGRGDPAGELSFTINGTPVFHTASSPQDEAMRKIGTKSCRAQTHRRPLGRLSDRGPIVKTEPERYAFWLAAGVGYRSHPLRTDRGGVGPLYSRRAAYESVPTGSLWAGHRGDLGEIMAAGLADRVVVDMVASVAADEAIPAQAAKEAECRANRYYKMHHG